MSTWTRNDLPSEGELADLISDALDGGIYEGKMLLPGHRLRAIIDLLARWLNAHYPKPEPDHKVPWKTAALNWEIRADRAKRERDAAIARAEAHAKGATRANLDRDTAYEELADMTNRAEKAERELAEEKRQHSDTIQVTDEQYTALMRERDDAVRERCYWKARAEEAEADLEELSEEFADFRVEVVAEAVKYRESNPQASGDDPAVYVVRESDIAAVEIERDERGWHGPGTTWTERSTSGEVRAHAEGLVRNVARCEAVARAIEAEPTVDPIEEKAIAAFKVAWHEADMHGDEGNRTRRGIRAARKVIEGG